MLWRKFAGANVGPAALVFNFWHIGIALERVFDGKAREAKIALNLFPGVEDQVQRNLVAPKVFFTQNFEADVKSEEEEAARLERAEHFAKCLEDIRFRNMHDGIESDDGGPGAVFHFERKHVALLEFDGGIQFARLLQHARRKIHTKDVHTALMQIARHMARSEEHTSELQSQSNLVCRLLLEKKKKKQYSNLKNSN